MLATKPRPTAVPETDDDRATTTPAAEPAALSTLELNLNQTTSNGTSRADGLTEARAAAAAKRARGEQLHRDPIERAQARPSNRRLAIAAKCFSCTGSGADSGWRTAIGACSVRSCPLHPHRPYQRADGGR